jgi:uncharacterized membrane protein
MKWADKIPPIGDSGMVDKLSNESRHDRFVRLASQRTQAVIDRIRVLGNCSNSYLYEYTEDEIRRIFKAIDDELKEVKQKFTKKRGERFSLE